ncbi:hypothetical protein C4J83_1790 [Pseudomonas sp. LBUM920]|nr:hypothetical protein C4J83_1790 [Pseudomonas sp. LBUM920]
MGREAPLKPAYESIQNKQTSRLSRFANQRRSSPLATGIWQA